MYALGTKNLTPVMKQYRDAKEAYPDAILFFRLGDFYEMFNDDAVVASRELQLTLTSRNKGADKEVPMAGVPYHAAHGYLTKLIAAGHKVAICEQMGDPSKIKGIVPRRVVRVLTPGLMTQGDTLEPRCNNYLAGIDSAEGAVFGLALLDVSTGELSACTLDGPAAVVAELSRTDPREVLLDAGAASLARALGVAAPRAACRQDPPLDEGEVRGHLDEGVQAPLFDDASQQHTPAAVRAAARVLRFARANMPDATLPVRRVGLLDPGTAMQIDETAQRHLELVRGSEGGRRGSLLEVIDTTVTPGGARLLRRRVLAPLTDVGAIRRRLDAVELMVTHARPRDELREHLKRIGDVERLAVRATLGEATPRDLGALRESLQAAVPARAAVATVTAASSDEASDVALLHADVDLLDDVRDLLTRALVDQPPVHARDGGVIAPGYDPELDELTGLRDNSAELIVALEKRLRARTEINNLKVKYTRAFGWYVEVSRSKLDRVPDDFRRKQSLTAAERYTNDELDELADKLTFAEERHHDREATLIDDLVDAIARRAPALQALARVVSEWDVTAALAETAHRHDYIRPTVDDGVVLSLDDARHPVVERHAEAGTFVPNDTRLDVDGERLLIITGPNMAGKSTLMRQVALSVVLAQMGSYVPARRAHVGIVDRLLSRVGASDNLAGGESTFMVEMRETASILRHATRRSLVILDEIGRGTSTFDGMAIAWAVAEYLDGHVGCRALFATHYHQLNELAEQHAGIANYSVSAREHEGDIVFLHRLTPGSVNKSYGVAVARLAGVPETVLGRAGAILASLEDGRTVRGGPRARGGAEARPQLDLFAPRERDGGETAALSALRTVDPNRLTPLEALQLVAQLKGHLAAPQ